MKNKKVYQNTNPENYTKLKYILLFTIAALQLSFFISCKDDPVTPKININDTGDVYIWKVIDIGGVLQQVYVADSNNIYLNAHSTPFFYDGQTINTVNLLDPGFRLNNIMGFDKNNIFFAGGYPIYQGNPILKKLTNWNITSFTLDEDSSIYFGSIFPEGPNKAWISSSVVYYFNSGVFKKYDLSDSAFGFYFFKREDILYLFTTGRKTSKEYLYSYKLVNDSFHLIREDLISYPEEKTNLLYNCGDELVMTGNHEGYNKLFYFNGNDWVYYLNTDFSIVELGGFSKEKLFALDTRPRLWIRDSTGQWAIEDSLFNGWYGGTNERGGQIVLKESRIYFNVQMNNLDSYFVIGIPKK